MYAYAFMQWMFVCVYVFFCVLLWRRRFEGEVLKATLATDAVIGACTSPYHNGSSYVLLHHVMGEADGKQVNSASVFKNVSRSRAAKREISFLR